MTTQKDYVTAFNQAYSLLISGKMCKLYRINGVWNCEEIRTKVLNVQSALGL